MRIWMVCCVACVAVAVLAAEVSQQERVAARNRLLPCTERGTRAITVDGDLADWGDLRDGGFAFHQILDVTTSTPHDDDPDAAVAKVLYDDAALYLALRVRDISVITPAKAGDFGSGDIVDLYLDVRPLTGEVGKRLGDNAYTDGVYQLNCSPASANGQPLVCQQATFQKVRAIGPFAAAGRREADGYTMEFRFPVDSLLPGLPAGRLRQPVGVEFMVGDTDGSDASRSPYVFYSWSGAGNYYRFAQNLACTDPGATPAQPRGVIYARPAVYQYPGQVMAALACRDDVKHAEGHLAVACRFAATSVDRVPRTYDNAGKPIPTKPVYATQSTWYRYPTLGVNFLRRGLRMTASGQGRYDIETAFPGLNLPPVTSRYYGWSNTKAGVLSPVGTQPPADPLKQILGAWARPLLETPYTLGRPQIRGVVVLSLPPDYCYALSAATAGKAPAVPVYRARLVVTPQAGGAPVWQSADLPLAPVGPPFTIPTATLPNGVYTVTLQVVEANGTVHNIRNEYPSAYGAMLAEAVTPLVVNPPRPIERPSTVRDARPLRTTATLIGNPTKTQFPRDNVLDCQARGVQDLQLYQGRIYVGCGDWNENRGPIQIWSFAPPTAGTTPDYAREFSVDDESVDTLRVYGDTLLVPGIDAADKVADQWALGNLYYKTDGA
jgi:hypothetical protein